MKDKLIEVIRSVPITDKTYSEYIEAVAQRLLEEIYFPPHIRFEAKAIPAKINVKYRDKIPESEMGMSGYSKFSWKLWEAGICDMQKAQRADQIMREQGYRKASEVAEEIFEEVDKRFEALLKFYPCNGEFEDAKRFVDFHWKHIKHSIMCDYDAELKKKYKEDGE